MWATLGLGMLIGVAMAASFIQEDQRLLHGARAVGTVVGRHIIEGSGDDTTEYRLDVRFPAGSRMVTERVEAEEAEYHRYTPGTPVTITYIPGDLSTNRLGVVTAQSVASDTETADIVLILVFAVLVTVPLLVEVPIRRQMRLMRFGRAATAMVERVAPSSRDSVKVTYHFEAQGGRWRGTSLYGSRANAKPVSGRPITILYMPHRPRENSPAASLLFVQIGNGASMD